MEHLYHTLLCQGSGTIVKEGAGGRTSHDRTIASSRHGCLHRSLDDLECPSKIGWLARESPREPLVSVFLWNGKKVLQHLTFYIGSGDPS